jgi:transposase
MIKKSKTKFKDGTYKTQIRVVEGVRIGNKITHHHIKGFGYLEDQADQEAFMKMVNEYDKNYQSSKKICLELDTKESWLDNTDDDSVYNFGYKFLESIYDSLEIKEFFRTISFQGRYLLDDVFKYLVIQRLLNPDSKRATYQMKEKLLNMNINFHLYDVYRALGFFNKASSNLQVHLNNKIKALIGRDEEKSFYDTTNYHFEIDFEDEDYYEELEEIVTDKKIIKQRKIIQKVVDGEVKQFILRSGIKKRGVSKQHQVTPIVQLSLMIDNKGLPMCMNLFPGNTNDGKTFIPTVENVKSKFNLNRLLIIADKGINSTSNIDYIVNHGDGFLFSQILRGKKGYRYEEKLFNESLYTVINEDNKYQTFIEEYKGHDISGNEVIRQRKVLLYYSGEDARRTKKKREEKINKAQKLIDCGLGELTHSSSKFIKKISSNKETGEIADNVELVLDDKKIEEESKFDGYCCIITSELDYDYKKIRETYHGLWRIEDSFKITKSDLYARPIYVTKDEHINGHFIICYTALLIIRMLQLKLNYELSVERIVRALNFCSCIKISNGIIKLVKNNSFIGFETKESSNHEEYISMEESYLNETIQDVKLIFKNFNVAQYGKFNRIDKFETQLKNIKYK